MLCRLVFKLLVESCGGRTGKGLRDGFGHGSIKRRVQHTDAATTTLSLRRHAIHVTKADSDRQGLTGGEQEIQRRV